MVVYKTAHVKGLSVFYREAGAPHNPTVVLLGGFPTSSHQFRNLLPALEDRFHLIVPDYPGFGNSEMPDPAHFAYTFDRLSEIIEGLLSTLDIRRFGLYMHDYGGPIGNRIIGRHPDWLEWLIVQNANLYEEGFTSLWDGMRHGLWTNQSPEIEARLDAFLGLEAVKRIYHHGHRDPALISPDVWNMDLFFLARPDAHRVQLDLLYDYRTNVALYPTWQAFLREHQPPTLILWGQHDLFFTPEGATAYRRDLPDAEIHLLDSGHFVLEDCLDEVVTNMQRFYREHVADVAWPAHHACS